MSQNDRRKLRKKLKRICTKHFRNTDNIDLMIEIIVNLPDYNPDPSFLLEIGDLYFFRRREDFFREFSIATCGGIEPEHVRVLHSRYTDERSGRVWTSLTWYEWSIDDILFIFHHPNDFDVRHGAYDGWILESRIPQPHEADDLSDADSVIYDSSEDD